MMSTRSMHAAMFGRAAAARADDAGGVAVVDMDQRAVALGEVADPVERGDIAVHREDAVGRDQLEARAGGVGRLQLRLEIGHVGIPVAVALRLAEPDAVDDRGVVELVRDDRVLGAEQGLEQAAIGVEAGGIEDRVLHPEPGGELVLELLVDRLGAADEADRGHAVAPALEPRLRRRLDALVLGEAEIIVGAQVDHVLRRSATPTWLPCGVVITRSDL